MMGLQDKINVKPTPMVRVQESSAVHDQGLYEGFTWIVDRIVEESKKRELA
jgi:hypothetical protein